MKGWLKAVTEGDIEGDIEGKCLPGRRRTAWIDDVRRWTVTEGEIEGKCLPGRRRTAWIDDVTMDCDRGRNRGKVFIR